ncbi:MAG: sucrase ferredoxin [Nocardioides sp.]
MTTPDGAFRCAAASALRDDGVAGSASTVRAFLLLEHDGPWGVDALRDARLPDGLGTALRGRAGRAGVRVLLVRRPDRERRGGPPYAFAARVGDPGLWGGRLGSLDDALDLDLAALRAGGDPGLGRHDGDLLCVCTHGRHDACCAERGRPVAAALAQAHPDETWEVSHIGGDRFAGNMLVLPDGFYYGRLDPVAALTVAGAHLGGHLDLDHLRGRSALPMPAQAAEVALRRALGETRTDAVRSLGVRVDGDLTRARFRVGDPAYGVAYDVVVRTAAGAPARLTCRAGRDNPVPRHEVLGIERFAGEVDQPAS